LAEDGAVEGQVKARRQAVWHIDTAVVVVLVHLKGIGSRMGGGPGLEAQASDSGPGV